MITSTTNSIEGLEITETLGVISGLSARTRNAIIDIGSDIKNIVGGEMVANGKLMKAAEAKALEELKLIATEMGADGIIGLRYETIKLDTGIGIYAYGTAVKIKNGTNGKKNLEAISEVNSSTEAV